MGRGRNSGDPPGRISAAQAGSAVGRNTVWNLIGTGLPILLALITVPVLIYSVGTERFGVLTIAWVLLGYFGLFDLGLGRATIKFLAEALEQNHVAEARALFWTSSILNAILGLISAFALAALSPFLVSGVLNIPAELQAEALGAFYLMSFSVPLVTLTSSLRGILEAQHKFGLLNVLQVPTASFTQVAPLLVLPFTSNLTWLIGTIAFSRLLGVVVFFVAALRALESPFEGPFFLRKRLGSLLSYGGWLSVTNAVSPLMVYVDRFVIGALASMTAVAYYTTPYEAVTRLWVLPQSLTRTMFPIISAEAAEVESERRTRLYLDSIKYFTLLFAPLIATIIVFAPDLLRLWIGQDFAENSTAVLQILAVGVLANSLAMIPFTLIQGLGRPDVTAKFHLLELPFYLILLWFGVQYFGIIGAAVAWTARTAVDALLLVLYVQLNNYLSPLLTTARSRWTMYFALLLLSGGWLLYEFTDNLLLKVALWGLLLSFLMLGTWRKLLTSEERKGFVDHGRRILARVTSTGPSPDDRKLPR